MCVTWWDYDESFQIDPISIDVYDNNFYFYIYGRCLFQVEEQYENLIIIGGSIPGRFECRSFPIL